ncbi:MAG TPA: hypothetical protein VGU64_17920, partial [Terriglobales bacterium]|nr:hypothetical protein [Terriglobales bacterium]
MSFWFLILFVLQILVGATNGGDDTQLVERSYRVTTAVLQFAGVAFGLMLLFGKEMFGGRVFRLERRTAWAFLLLGTWTALALIAFVNGYLSRYEETYVFGDFYKFLLLPLLFMLAYFGLRKQNQLDAALMGLVIVMG